MSFPRYPNYKPSGVEWLGDVPEHWGVKPLKYLAGIDSCGSYGVEPDGGEVALPVATTAQIDSAGKFAVDRMPMRGFTPVEVQRYGCSAGDILVVKSSGSATNIISGKAGLVDELTPSFVFSNFLMRVRPELRRALPKFIYALLTSNLTRQRVELMCSTTTYPNLQIPDYTSAPLPEPPLAEQTAIAEFLDRETGKIDELVAEQRRLMELLQEKRQSVISHAVTQGLNPHAPMKPSGIEWLGEVPVGWKVFPLNRLVQAGRRITYGIVQPGPRDEGGSFMVRGQDYSFGWAEPETLFRVSDEVEIPYRRARLIEGDLVITIVGAGVGNVAVVPSWLDGANITQTTARISVDPAKADPRFVSAVLKGPIGRRSVELYAKGAAQPGLNLEHVRIFPITVPPLSEQREIADYIETETAKFDTLTAEAQNAIDLLQERRTALISAAVTGQIDVRNHSPKP